MDHNQSYQKLNNLKMKEKTANESESSIVNSICVRQFQEIVKDIMKIIVPALQNHFNNYS